MDTKNEKAILKKEIKMAKGCACIEIERKNLEIAIDKEYRYVKPKVILNFYENLDFEHFCNLVLNCKCFDKNMDPNYINPTTLINAL